MRILQTKAAFLADVQAASRETRIEIESFFLSLALTQTRCLKLEVCS